MSNRVYNPTYKNEWVVFAREVCVCVSLHFQSDSLLHF